MPKEEKDEGENFAAGDDLIMTVMKATMPAAIRRYEQKIAHMGMPRLCKTMEERYEQFFCFGYCSAVYDMLIGEIKVESQAPGTLMPEPVETPQIILLGDPG